MTDTPFILPLAQCTDVATVGGKAVNLGAIIRGGFAVPDGFAVTTAAYRDPCEIPAAVADAIVAAYRAMGGGAVAVRSSATAEDMAGASMAGQYDTFLHVADEPSLLDAVRRCWQSVRSDRTTSYLAGHGIDVRSVAMAVVVQRLVRADVAGVLFTANPHTGERSEMLAEATWGLGETLVAGRVQPDVLRIDRATGRVTEQRIGDKRIMTAAATAGEVEVPADRRQAACLGDSDVAALWRLGVLATNHFGAEQDIEWAIEAGQLYLLQSRPITTLDEAEAYQRVLQQTRDFLGSRSPSSASAFDQRAEQGLRDPRTQRLCPGPWVRHNLGETLPHPTPLTWSVLQPFMTGAGGFGKMYRLAGFEPSPDVCRDGFLTLLAGRIYMDASRAAGMFFDRFPYRYDVELLRDNPDAAQSPPTIADGSLWRRWRTRRRIGVINRRLSHLADDFDRDLRQSIFPAFGDYCAAERRKDLAAMSPAELADCWRARRSAVLDDFAPQSLLPSLIEGMALADLKQLLAEEIWDEDAAELATALSSSPVPNLTLLADAGLYAVASGKRTVDDWLKQFGHRSAGEFDLSTPRWREQPAAVRKMADRLAGGADPMALHESHAAAIRQKAAAVRDRLSPAAAKAFDRRLDLVWRYIGFREDGKYFLMLGYALLRDVALEIGRRAGVGDGVFFLTEQEMLALVGRALPAGVGAAGETTSQGANASKGDAPFGGQCPPYPEQSFRPSPQPSPGVPGEGVRQLIASRRLTHRVETRISLPHVITAADIDHLGTPPPLDSAGIHRAFAVSTGVATGPAKIVRSPGDAGELGAGYVLVCPSTDPNWTPLFVNAAALVLECGGTLSHGAVVAREMGLPAVVLPDATRLFADGQRLRVDGHHGAVGPADERSPATSVLPYDAGEVNANDPHIAPALAPPPAGAKDRRAAHWAKIGLVVWGLYLLLAFALPEQVLYQPSLRLLDVLIWPLVPAVGKVWTVAIIAIGIAFVAMALQRVMTDNRRLKVAKQRMAALARQASALPPASPRARAVRRLSAGVQGRLLSAAMVPMAVALGPMVMIFFWCTARMDPANWNAPPGSVVHVEAECVPWAVGDARLEVAGPLQLDPATPAKQAIEDASTARTALEEMLSAWESPTGNADESIRDQIERAKSRGETPAVLREYLRTQRLSPRPLRWTVHTPEQSGRWPIAVHGSDGATHWMKVVVGDSRPPEPLAAAGDDALISRLTLTYERQPPKSFWTPLADVTSDPVVQHGWNHWAVGWLAVYLLAYLPAMAVWRRVLGVP